MQNVLVMVKDNPFGQLEIPTDIAEVIYTHFNSS